MEALPAEDSAALLGEAADKLGGLDALIREQEAQQNQMLKDALERRRRRRAGVQGQAAELADQKQVHQEKLTRKLAQIQEQEKAEIAKVEQEVERKRKEGLAEIDEKLAKEKEKKVKKLKKELLELKESGGVGQKAFNEKMSQYKDALKSLERQEEKDRLKQRADLEERLARRRAARMKQISEDTKEKEFQAAEASEEKGTRLAKELEAVEAILSPIEGQEEKLEQVNRAMANAATQVIQKAAPDLLENLEKDEELNVLGAAAERVQQVEDHKVADIQKELAEEVERAGQAAADIEKRRQELKARMEAADDEGEKRRLIRQLDQLNKEWQDLLAQENELQHRKLKAALEARRRARKKAKDELAGKKEEKMVQAVATALDGIVSKEEGVAEQRGRDLIGTIDREFGPKDQIQAAESYLDQAHQQQQLDLMNAMYAERSRVLKKLVFEMMNQKQAEYDLIRSEYDPQYHFLKDKKSKGLIAPNDYKARLEKLTEEENDRKMDVEIEYNEREQRLQEEIERLRLEKEAALKEGLHQLQNAERRTALQELQQLQQDSGALQQYLAEQQKVQEKELRQMQRQIEKEKADSLKAIEDERQRRLQEIRDKEEKMLNLEGRANAEEERIRTQFAKQKEAILKQKQLDQEREMTQGLSKEEAAKLMERHKEALDRLEGVLAAEQERQMAAMRGKLARRNQGNAKLKVQRQIKMAAVNKRKAEQKAAAEQAAGLETKEQELAAQEALAKCQSKCNRLRRVVFKGGWSRPPELKRRVVERTLALERRLGGAGDPLSLVLYKPGEDKLNQELGATGKLSLQSLPLSRGGLNDSSLRSQDADKQVKTMTLKELREHVDKAEQRYQQLSGTATRRGDGHAFQRSATGSFPATSRHSSRD